jgi:hypothetical protein
VIHQQNKQVNMVGAATATHQISDQTGKGNGDALIAPPAYILGASTQTRIMQLMQQHQHLQTPSSSKNQKGRCVASNTEVKSSEATTNRMRPLHLLNIMRYHHYVAHHTGSFQMFKRLGILEKDWK